MFCADWALSLGLWFGLVRCHPPLAATGDAVRVVPAAAATGFAASLLLHPFDFVRGSFAASRSRLPLSTTAFTTVAFGGYWTGRDPRDPRSRAGWALAAGLAGSLAELPWDRAKTAIVGGGGVGATLALVRAPLGAMLLFAVDEALIRGAGKEEEVGVGHGEDEMQQ